MKNPLLHWFVAAVGALLLVVGVIGAARAWSAKGLAYIFAAGVICLLLALVADRITTITGEKGADGSVKIGVVLKELVTAEVNKIGFSGLASIYAFVHHQLTDPDLKTVKVSLQDQLVKIAQQNAFSEPVDQQAITTTLQNGQPSERVLAFGLLVDHPNFATMAHLLQGINHSESGNEQYYALLATKARWPKLNETERRALQEAIRTAPHLRATDLQDADRRKVADEILAMS
jgi:hypothetical protein